MKTLECNQCGDAITKDDWGIKFDDLYFCSQECLDAYVDMMQEPISERDFELYGEDDEDDEVVNDYDIQMGTQTTKE